MPAAKGTAPSPSLELFLFVYGRVVCSQEELGLWDDGPDVREWGLGSETPVRGSHESLKVNAHLLWVILAEKERLDTYVLHTHINTHTGFFFHKH